MTPSTLLRRKTLAHLLGGVLLLLCTSFWAAQAGFYMPGILSMANAAALGYPPPTVRIVLYQNLVNWGVLWLLCFIIGKIRKTAPANWLQSIATTGLARFPYALFAVFLWLTSASVPELFSQECPNLEDPSPTAVHFAIGVLGLVALQLRCYWQLLKHQTLLFGPKLWLSFPVFLLIAEIISSKLALVLC